MRASVGFGGADRDRTDDLLNAIQALSQLSYSPNLVATPLTPRSRQNSCAAQCTLVVRLKKPEIQKPRLGSGAFSLSRKLPKLNLPTSSAAVTPNPPRPKVGRPGKSIFGKRSR